MICLKCRLRNRLDLVRILEFSYLRKCILEFAYLESSMLKSAFETNHTWSMQTWFFAYLVLHTWFIKHAKSDAYLDRSMQYWGSHTCSMQSKKSLKNLKCIPKACGHFTFLKFSQHLFMLYKKVIHRWKDNF